MFQKFGSNEERRAFGGSCFIEIQYCRFPVGNDPEKIVSIDAIVHWDLTSLYICDEAMDKFCIEYKDILNNGLYSNMEEGVVDSWGINYYDERKSKVLMERLRTNKPQRFEMFFKWLEENPYHNGFYILGV